MFRIFKKAKNSLLSIARNIKKNEAEHLHHKINSAEGNVLSVYQFRLKTLEFDLAHMDEEERVDMQIIKLNNDIEKHLLTGVPRTPSRGCRAGCAVAPGHRTCRLVSVGAGYRACFESA